MAEVLDRLRRRLKIEGTEQDALLNDLIADAAAFAQGYTGRAVLPEAADAAITELAATSYGRLGMEGQSAHAEGSVSIRVDGLPAMLKALLDQMRVAKVG